jgi:hypothetical protein
VCARSGQVKVVVEAVDGTAVAFLGAVHSGHASLAAVAVALAIAVAGCGDGEAKPVRAGAGCAALSKDTGCGVLFIGNSYTSVNDLPKVFAKLAESGGISVSASALDPGGATLAQHLDAPATAAEMRNTTLNVVVLQEQSQIAASRSLVDQQMAPAAAHLVANIRGIGAEPVLLETWGHRDGWPEAGITTYADMQRSVSWAYRQIARTLGVKAAPAGDAWADVLSRPAHPLLWQDDGSHPTPSGTYLAACALFAVVFDQDPEGLPYRNGLSAQDAVQLQQAAWLATRRQARVSSPSS